MKTFAPANKINFLKNIISARINFNSKTKRKKKESNKGKFPKKSTDLGNLVLNII